MNTSTATLLFATLFCFRYLRLLVGIFANATYKALPVREHSQYSDEDVTVIVPTTFKDPAILMVCLGSIYNCGPARLLVVTADAHVESIQALGKLCSIKNLKVLGVEHLNKRHQMLCGLEYVDTEIVVFADDNVIWPMGYLPHLLAVFERPQVGAGGTRQRVRRHAKPDIWNFLAISYLERRVWNNISTQAIDGSISTLSGRTAAYRSKILKTEAFAEYFNNDYWLGYPLSTDDDKCMTRYVYAQGWQVALQGSVVIETSMESGFGYLAQCIRWSRAHWRGNFTVMTNERYWFSTQYIWGLYAIYTGQFQTPAILIDWLLCHLLLSMLAQSDGDTQTSATIALSLWIMFTKLVKLIPHLWRHPADIRFIPASLLFSYLHGIINIYALCTLHVTSWGSQKLEVLEQPRVVGNDMSPLMPQNQI